jgi:hypothetical protein
MSYMEDNGIWSRWGSGGFQTGQTDGGQHFYSTRDMCTNQKRVRYSSFFFLDLSKTFDRVWRDGLFYLLWKNGIHGVYVDIVYELWERGWGQDTSLF